MNTELQPILKHSSISEQEFLDGHPVVFGAGACIITAIYRNDKVILESSTYESLIQHRIREQHKLAGLTGLAGELTTDIANPIVIENLDMIPNVLNDIAENTITTKLLYEENDENLDYLNKKCHAWDGIISVWPKIDTN